MKKIFMLLAFFAVVTVSAQEKSKNKKIAVEVSGNCEMCKKRIEKAAFGTKGVKSATWTASTQTLDLIINEHKTDMLTVQNNIAAIGHDTKDVKASNEAYEGLHSCCKYTRKSDCKPGCTKACCTTEQKKSCSSSSKKCQSTCASKKKTT